jgi:hypothetical protein
MQAVARLPDFVVVNAAREPDDATGTTAAELAVLGIVRPDAVLGRGESVGLEALAEALLSRT